MSTILVTGGAGYIGSHACKALAGAGYEPIAYDNLVYGHRGAVKWGPLEEGDIADQGRLLEAFVRYQPAAVMHFAAYAYVGESMTDPAKYYVNNVAGTLSLLNAMRASGVHRMVFSSTCATYGIPTTVPIRGDHSQAPISPYGRSKLMVEQILRDYGHAYGLRTGSLRYFNAAGADPDGEIGEDHDPETHLIPLVLQAASGRGGRVTIFGDDYDTPDGTCIRDYIHVTDLAQAHVLALDALDRQDGFRAFNLGTGSGVSVREIVDTAEAVSGAAVPARVGDRRAGDPPALVADAARAVSELGWRPRYTDIRDIVETAWRWEQRRAEDRKATVAREG